jgi:diguanylate cyclase (GGDEF)-like protein
MKQAKDKKIEDLEKRIRHLRKLVHYDGTTGFYNRAGFLDKVKDFINALKSELSGVGKQRKLKISNLSIVFADLNNLKEINDKFGHQCGDEAIVAFGKLLAENVRGMDIVSRWSGDEFVIALVGADKKGAMLVVEKIKMDLAGRALRACGLSRVSISASFGIASVYDKSRKPGLIFDLKQLVAEADKKMYKEKKRRR